MHWMIALLFLRLIKVRHLLFFILKTRILIMILLLMTIDIKITKYSFLKENEIE